MTTLPDRPSVHDFLAAPIEVALDVAGLTPSCGNADEPNERALQMIGTKAEAWYACDQGFAKVTVTHRNEAHHSLDAGVLIELTPWRSVTNVGLRSTKTLQSGASLRDGDPRT